MRHRQFLGEYAMKRHSYRQVLDMLADSSELRREVEKAYRRGFSQGAACGAYSVAEGYTAEQLEQWRKDVYQWRCKVHREAPASSVLQWAIQSPPPMPKGLKGGESC